MGLQDMDDEELRLKLLRLLMQFSSNFITFPTVEEIGERVRLLEDFVKTGKLP